jgi:phosphoglycolate phosphatase
MWMVERNVDLVISDLGGVLIDTFEAIVTVIERVAKKNNVFDGKVENIYKFLGTSIENYIKAYLTEEHKDKIDTCYDDFMKSFPISVLHMLKPFYGVDQTLEFLHSQEIIITVVSCLSDESIDMCLSRLQFKGIRDKKHYERTEQDSEQVDEIAAEQDTNPIDTLVDEYGVSKERTVYVGDTVADVKLAKRAGVISVAVKSGILGQKDPQQLINEKPDYFLSDLRGLPGVVLKRKIYDGM